MRESIEPFITRRVLVLNLETPSNVAARALHERRVGSAVVSDKYGHIVGVVTDRDLCTQILGFDMPPATPLSEIMTTDILKVKKNSKINDAVRIMEVNGIRRLPVVERTSKGKEKCVGMVTLDDLLASRSLSLDSISKIVKNQIYKSYHISHSDHAENRKEQTMNRFNKIMAEILVVSKPLAERVSFFLLKQIVQRLSYTMAAHFISQLPKLLHEDLLSLPAGPNTKINDETIVMDLMDGFQVTRSIALDLIKNFWSALEKILNPGILDHVLAQFPHEMRELFVGDAAAEPYNLDLYTYNGTSHLEQWP